MVAGGEGGGGKYGRLQLGTWVNDTQGIVASNLLDRMSSIIPMINQHSVSLFSPPPFNLNFFFLPSLPFSMLCLL